jgi:DNA-directed RNA polymerase specialized sigma24 family protein
VPERDRKVLAARYEREEPLESIARQEKQTMGYIKQRLFRLRRRLARCVRSRLQE